MTRRTSDFWSAAVPSAPVQPELSRRQERGRRACLSGLAAEEAVIRAYAARDTLLLERRWRGRAGEIDAILRAPDTYVFCEVKKAATFDQALQRLRAGQMERICVAASEYLGLTPEGQLAAVRFDLAVVDGRGAVRILENAFDHF